MRPSWPLALILAALTQGCATEVYRRLQPPLDQRLQNADLEQLEGGQLAGWRGYGAGFAMVAGEGRHGTRGAVCRRPAGMAEATGIVQTVDLNQTRPTPLHVSAWSRAEDVSGGADSNYALFCDLVYTDGTPLWGQAAAFSPGTHGWAKAEVIISPAKPVRQITIYGLFRGHNGTAWFDDFALAELGGEGVTMLDGVAVEPIRTAAAQADATWTAGPLSVAMAGTQIADVKLGGTSVKAASAGGFLIRDVAADSGYHTFDRGQALGVALQAKAESAGQAIHVTAQVTDDSGQDRALTILFAVPLEAIGWQWGQSADEARPIEPVGQYGSFNIIEAGSTGQLSNYPLANVAGPAGAVNLAIDPRRPALYRLGFSGSAKLLYLAFDIALPSALLGQPASAELSFDIFPSDPAWGFRAALERFYALHPDVYQVRCPDQGIWQAFAKISPIQGWEDFGFKFKEGDNEVAWDDAHDILTFRYSEMGTYWLSMPPEMPRTYDHAVALMEQRAADPNAPGHVLAKATLESGMHDRDGRYMMLFKKEPWCDGAVFSLNPSPSLTGFTQAEVAWGEAKKAAYQRAGAGLDGEYLDSLEGYVTAPLNFRIEHLKQSKLPLTFTRDDRRPVLHKAFSIGEFVIHIADDLHGMGKLLMANGTPYRFGFMSVWFDLMGTETNWCPNGTYQPNDDRVMALRRAWAGQKPYLLLQNTRFEPFGPHVEKYFARALAYGMYPSMFSHNAAQDHYFQNPAWYNRDRALFKEYIPKIRQVAEEGWQPITAARCDNPAIHLERFGPGRTKSIFVTVHNPTDQPQAGRVTFDAERLGQAAEPQRVSLAPYGTEVVKVR